MANNIIFVPGTLTQGHLYGPWPAVDIWLKHNQATLTNPPDIVIAYSLGATWAVTNLKITPATKFILINPLLIKKPWPIILFNWFKYLNQEGFKESQFIKQEHWWSSLKLVFKLIKIDLLPELIKIPKSNLLIIKGEDDSFFCDQTVKTLAERYNLPLKLVKAGHNWNANIFEQVQAAINKPFN
ncbi:hypothetical protein KKC17_03455 [Patescibacteria group bacterium]|nr:hypothetical protein [Patescibacteria group bacterium]